MPISSGTLPASVVKLTAVEAKLLAREPGSFFAVVIPLFILVIFGFSLTPGDAVLLPTTLAIGVGLVGLYLVPTTLATYRERGILRRLAATPLRPEALLAVQLLLQLGLAVLGCGLLPVAVGALLGAAVPRPGLVPWAVAVFLLGAVAMFAIGLVIAAVAANGRSANGIGVLLYFPLAYLAGLMQPRHLMPEALAQAGEFTPLGAFVRSLRDLWAGDAPHPVHMGIMAAYAALAGLAAAKSFRWE